MLRDTSSRNISTHPQLPFDYFPSPPAMESYFLRNKEKAA